jgi:methionine-rich copper-binding protein CopC
MRRYFSLTVMSVATLAAGAALAHTELKATIPADRAMIANAPENVELTFSEPVRLTALSIQRDREQKLSLGPLPSETTESFSVALPTTISDGHYVVAWRALSEDTHVMSGEFMFAVGAEGSDDAHVSHHEDMPATEHHAMPAGEHHNEHGGAH